MALSTGAGDGALWQCCVGVASAKSSGRLVVKSNPTSGVFVDRECVRGLVGSTVVSELRVEGYLHVQTILQITHFGKS